MLDKAVLSDVKGLLGVARELLLLILPSVSKCTCSPSCGVTTSSGVSAVTVGDCLICVEVLVLVLVALVAVVSSVADVDSDDDDDVVAVEEADNGCSSGTSFLVRCFDKSLFMPKLLTLSTWKIVLSLSSQRIKRLSLGSCRSLPLMYFHNRLTISGLDSY